MPTVLCMNNGLLCGYITDIYFCLWTKEASHHVSHDICHNPTDNDTTICICHRLLTTYAIMLGFHKLGHIVSKGAFFNYHTTLLTHLYQSYRF